MSDNDDSFPFKVEISKSVLRKWKGQELPSYEDHNEADDHVYAILDRYKTRVEIRSVEEAATVIKSARYWGHHGGWTTRDFWGWNERFADALKNVETDIEEQVKRR